MRKPDYQEITQLEKELDIAGAEPVLPPIVCFWPSLSEWDIAHRELLDAQEEQRRREFRAMGWGGVSTSTGGYFARSGTAPLMVDETDSLIDGLVYNAYGRPRG